MATNTKQLYFDWLISHVNLSGLADSRMLMLSHLHSIPFVCYVEEDRTLLSSSHSLRLLFLREKNLDVEELTKLSDQASVLEILIHLNAEINSFLKGYEMRHKDDTWFWRMIKNIGLMTCVDDSYYHDTVDHIILTFVSRTYTKNGEGNIFTTRTRKDFREICLWQQFQIHYEDYYFSASIVEWRDIL